MTKSAIVFGVDIGGSHITVAPVDLESRKILPQGMIRGGVDSKGSAEEIIRSWAENIRKSFDFFPDADRKIGVAMPGPFDYERGICLIKENNKYEALYELNVRDLLARELNVSGESILFKNDAGCFLQGEAYGGVAQGYSRAIGMTLGTGIGTAFMEDYVAEDEALWCMPFKDGVVENYISTIWFLKRFQELGGDDSYSVKYIAEAFHSNEKAGQVFREFAENFSEFVLTFAQQRQPEVIVIGGNIMRSYELFIPQVEATLKAAGIKAPIKRALLGEEAAIIGAASLQAVSAPSVV